MENAVLVAKMHVTSVLHSKLANGETESESVKLTAVYSDKPDSENAQWAKWTPWAQFDITINNPDALGTLSRGHEYLVYFIPVGRGHHDKPPAT